MTTEQDKIDWNKVVSILWGDDHYEDTIKEMIEYMDSDGLGKQEIVGIEVELCEEANVYDEQDCQKIEDVIYGESEIYEGRYFEEKRVEIMKLIESIKYHSPFKKYIITEEDYNNTLEN